jgi:mono/diheme cytochrome c family protein
MPPLLFRRDVRFLVPLIGAMTLTLAADESASAEQPRIEFARDVLPILSAHCFACHGPDATRREADLRLDIESAAKQTGDQGAAIAPGQPSASLLITRITSTDPDQVMPPPDSNRKLDSKQIEILHRWVEQGAYWQQHWAFSRVTKPEGSIDELVKKQLAARGMSLRPAASPHTLVRRLSLDLLGLPPTPELADAFAQNPSPVAYEQLVNELLSRPQFGEHWARMWLDLARYADTKGYEKDRGRTVWPYRDWVVGAFNSDMPLDKFTVEQLAGDLLPNPTTDQLIATAFHRNTMSNDEGGTDDEEFRVAAVKDRIETTVQVWMGLTMKCAQCHTHKYDPIPIEDYYRFFAIFNQTEDADRPDDAPRLELATAIEQTRLTELRSRIANLKHRLLNAKEQTALSTEDGKAKWIAPQFNSAKSIGGANLAVDEQFVITVNGESAAEDTYEISLTLPPGRYTALQLETLPVTTADGKRALGRNPDDPNFVLSELTLRPTAKETAKPWPLTNPRADFAQDGWPATAAIDGDPRTGWAIGPQKDEHHVLILDFAEPLHTTVPSVIEIRLVQSFGNQLTLARFRLSISEAAPETLSPDATSDLARQLMDELAATEKQLRELNASIVQLPILRELSGHNRRQTRIHNRGNFLDQGTLVTPAILSAFHPLNNPVVPDRLEVAQWLVSHDNPLTSRVWANRIWSRLFGRGLVETEEDFGTLGAAPSHPELLDLLSAEYRDGGWSLKRLLKIIVMSDTYKQSSQTDAELLESDPDNRWLSRAPRYRLTGEALRDQALSVSGLLSLQLGGAPVMPPQPEGLWRSTYSGEQWIDAQGDQRFRRGLYTYLKRTTPYPSLTTLDGGSGEVCLIRRVRTNTPLQALITLNDPVFFEAAAALATRMITETDSSDAAARAERGLRLALIRSIRDGELEPLLRLREDALLRFTDEPDLTAKLLESARIEPDRIAAMKVDDKELAAWVIVATAILNLDEFLTRN